MTLQPQSKDCICKVYPWPGSKSGHHRICPDNARWGMKNLIPNLPEERGRIYVALVVDDLDARDDRERSDRIATYSCTKEEIATIMGIIKKHRKGNRP